MVLGLATSMLGSSPSATHAWRLTEGDASMGQGGHAIVSTGIVQGQGASTSKESCRGGEVVVAGERGNGTATMGWEIGRASCRERV